jgi:uncharacterized protein (TIGR02147 family)
MLCKVIPEGYIAIMNMMIKHIQNTFTERCRSNEQYSLRAYARSLNVPVSSLSEIINEKRPLTKNLRDKIGLALNMTQEQIDNFEVQEHGNSKKSAQDRIDADYRQIALDSFYIISEWHHYGILQLMRTEEFKNNPKWIATRLNIETESARIAIERLIRVGVIEVQKNGSLKDMTMGKTSHLKSDFTNEQLKNFQIKALEKAILSIKEVPIHLRDNTTMTMAISKKALPFAKEEIKKFRRQLTKKLEAFNDPDEVYQLAIGLNPLTNIQIENTGAKNENI